MKSSYKAIFMIIYLSCSPTIFIGLHILFEGNIIINIFIFLGFLVVSIILMFILLIDTNEKEVQNNS